VPEILPPKRNGSSLQPRSLPDVWNAITPAQRRIVFWLSAGFLFSVLMFAIGQFFQIRGVQSLIASRIFLLIALASAVLLPWGFVLVSRRKTWMAILASLMLLLATVVLDRAYPLRNPAESKQITPFISLRITPSAFPFSVAPRTTLSILPLHPYQIFAEGSGALHVFDNYCGEEHFWPSQEELDSRPKNAYEEVRLLEIDNHSQTTMEMGKVAFQVMYNETFAGGCIPPSKAKLQEDVISIPALDAGKSFQFISVNQTKSCAWLIAPNKIKVRMTGDDIEHEIPLKIEDTNIPNVASTPFSPTNVQWLGVPVKNPGYGVVRSAAQCQMSRTDLGRL